MAEPDEVRFACPNCGAWDSAMSQVCPACGHANATKDPSRLVRLPRSRPLPPLSLNPYEPPAAPITSPRTFRIGTALVLIAIIAVCLGALRANVTMGIVLILSLVPATIRTMMVAADRSARGQPMGFDEQFQTFVVTLGAVYLIAVSCAIAFVATCFPAGMITQDIGFALAFGGTGAIAAGVWVTSLLLKNRAPRPIEPWEWKDL